MKPIARSHSPASRHFVTRHNSRPSRAWQHKMAMLEKIHGEIAPQISELNPRMIGALELTYFLD
jgi:hypothetical protein